MATRGAGKDGGNHKNECQNFDCTFQNSSDLNPSVGLHSTKPNQPQPQPSSSQQGNSSPNQQLAGSRSLPNESSSYRSPPAPMEANPVTGKFTQATKFTHKYKARNKNNDVKLTVCHWNCASGLSNKLVDIKLAIAEIKPTVIFISEADRKLFHDDKLIQIKGYTLHNSKSQEIYNKSRIIAYTRDGSNLKRRQDLESPDDELIIFDKTFQNSTQVDRIIGLYRPFTGPDGDRSS
jgi:hypothetical protein